MHRELNFQAAWWCSNSHVQSFWRCLFTYQTQRDCQFQRINTPDGDFFEIVWQGERHRPLVILLHGLEGSFYSTSIQLLFDYFLERNYQVLAMQHRGCGEQMNRLPESYNVGEYKDFSYLLEWIEQQGLDVPQFAIGLSLGGNIIMRYLAHHPDAVLQAAVGVSVPFQVAYSEAYLPRFYQRLILRSMKQKVVAKLTAGIDMPVNRLQLRSIKSLRQFDQQITAPVYGFDTVDDYYAAMSVRQHLKLIKPPTLLLSSKDDPFVPLASLPQPRELSDSMEMELYNCGGHVGFVNGRRPYRSPLWLPQRLFSFIDSF